MNTEEIRMVEVYTKIGVFYSRFSTFESLVMWITGILMETPPHIVTILQTESPTFARIKCLKKIIETNKVDDVNQAEIRRILNKFGTNIIPFRNKLAHGTFYLTPDGLDIGSTDDGFLQMIGRKPQPKITEHLLEKIKECDDLIAQLASLSSLLTAARQNNS